MTIVSIFILWFGIGLIGLWIWQAAINRQRAYQRLDARSAQDYSTNQDFSSASVDVPVGNSAIAISSSGRRLSRDWIWLPWVIGIGIALTVWLILRWPLQYVIAIAAVASLLLSQLEGFLHARHIALLERQLADAIDIMIGAVSSGAAVGPAIDAATFETERPLKPYLEELSGRIRLGDEPIQVFRSLADRVPLETFLLFSSSLAVHYEVGGRLAPTLATVGRTIRDRIEVTRRIQSNIAQSQFSTFAILGLIYLIAIIVWRNGPEPMREFVTSTVGSWFVAGSIIMQAVGIAWMNIISKARF
jgi:tight adherence protein B